MTRLSIRSAALVAVVALSAGACSFFPSFPGSSYPGLQSGSILSVFGVEQDDTVNLLSLPGSGDVVASLNALVDDLIATGQAQLVDGTTWYEVTDGDVTGWIEAQYAGIEGQINDLTAQYLGAGATYSAPTAEDLAVLVATYFAGSSAVPGLTISGSSSSDGLYHVSVDYTGSTSAAISAIRYTVSAQLTLGGAQFVAVDSTAICAHSVLGGVCA